MTLRPSWLVLSLALGGCLDPIWQCPCSPGSICEEGVCVWSPDRASPPPQTDREPSPDRAFDAEPPCAHEAEDTVGDPCPVGATPACSRAGTLECDPAGGVTCRPPPVTGEPEMRCDGADDDCDGVADEGFALGEPCAVGDEAACAMAGAFACDPAGGVVCRRPRATAAPEARCDGVDDDCDGVADEGFALGEPCAVGRAPACTVSGERVCAADGATTACRPTVLVGDGGSETRCDGIDDDCDGQVDEGLIDTLATEQRGVCAGSTLVCDDAGERVEPGADDIPHREAYETSCDLRDNDCDGMVDERNHLELRPAWLDVGICAGLTLRCVDGQQIEPTDDEITEERPKYEPDHETQCDGLDNDCDGMTDEAGDLGPLAPLADGVRGEAHLAGLSAVCVNARKVCAGADWVNPSRAELEAQARAGGWPDWEADERTCDGRDNDCDSAADEALTAPLADNQQGICGGTRQICDGRAGWVEPDYATAVDGYQAAERTCDGRDNDCDGIADEAADLDAPLAGLPGVCRDAVQVCASGDWVVPALQTVEGYSATDDACDGADDNCDGTVDEGAMPRVCGPDPGEVVLEGVDDGDVPDSENRSICRQGMETCPMRHRQGWGACSGAVEASASETCGDGLDNDCDGWTDEGCFGGPCTRDADCPTIEGIAPKCHDDGPNGRCGFGPVGAGDEVGGCGCQACYAWVSDGNSFDDAECEPCRARLPACGGRGRCARPDDGSDACYPSCTLVGHVDVARVECRPGWHCAWASEDWQTYAVVGGQLQRADLARFICRPNEE